MTEEGYRDMVIDHDKHLDSLTQSVCTLADNVKSTNNKLDDVIDVMQTQNVLTERMSNLDHKFRDSFERVHTKIEDIEDEQKTFIPVAIIKWFGVIMIGYTVTFGTFVVTELHNLDSLTSKKVVLQEQIHENQDKRFQNIEKDIERLTEKHTKD